MGRTNPTFRDALRALRQRWADYRRALRRRDQPHFDRLLAHADAHADAASYLNADDPTTPVLLSMLLAHERRLAAVEERLAALEERPATVAESADAPDTDGDVRDTDTDVRNTDADAPGGE